MIEHNLLTPQERTFLTQQLWYLIVRRFVITFCTLFVLAAGLLYLNQYLLSQESSTLDSSISASLQETILKEGGPLQDNIRKINSTLSSYQNIQSKFIPWSPFFGRFFEQIPQGISVYSVTVDSSTKTMSVEGTAKTRADMLKLRSNLEKFYAFTEIRSTGSDLTQRENIDFTVTASLSGDFWIPPTQQDTDEPAT